MTPKRLLLAVVAAAGLAGCGTTECVTYTDYLDSRSPPPLRIPAGMQGPNRSGDMRIPGGPPAAAPAPDEDRCLAAPPQFYAEAGAPNPDGLPLREADAKAAGGARPGAGPAAGASLVTQSVAGFLAAWAGAWSQRDAEAWFGFYTADYAPAGYGSHEEWRESQLPRFDIPAATTVEEETLEVSTGSDGRARARFVQTFGTPPDTRQVVKEVILEPTPQAGEWRIVQERIVEVL